MIAFAAWHALKGRVEFPLTFQVPRMLRKLIDEAEDRYALFWNDRRLWKRERWPAYRDRPEIWDHAGVDDFTAMLEALTALGAVQYRADGREADELLASVAHMLEGSEPIVIHSDDKDFMQLLSPSTAMRGRVRGVVRAERVEQLLGVTPEYVADFLALTGDKVDGIPRVLTPVPARRVLAAHGHVRDWMCDPPEDPARETLVAQREQLEINVALVDLGHAAVGDPPPPILDGLGDFARARATGERLKIPYLTDAGLEQDFATVREWGDRSRDLLAG